VDDLIGIALFALSCALLLAVYLIIDRRGGIGALIREARSNQRLPLVLYGLSLILLSYIWALVSPGFVNPNSKTSVVVVLGGSTLLFSAGFALIGYRIWTGIAHLFR